MPVEPGDEVVVEYIAVLPNGAVFDTSLREVAEKHGLDETDQQPFEPLRFEIGAGGPYEAFEEVLVGMETGEQDTAYAQFREEFTIEYEHEEFREMLDGTEPAEGVTVAAADGTTGTVTSVDEDGVTVDFSHDLAGEQLEFKLKVVEIR